MAREDMHQYPYLPRWRKTQQEYDQLESTIAEQQSDIDSLSNLLDVANKELLKRAKQLDDKDMEITTLNLALLERDREIERLKSDLSEKDRESVKWSELVGSFTKSQHAYLRQMELLKRENSQLQKDLDQVVGEAVGFAGIVKTTRVWADDVQQAIQFLTSPLVQSWRERQGKEGK